MIELKAVTKSFAGRAALEKIHLTLQEGAVCGLIGANGAGKSTLLHVLAGVYRPDEGVVMVRGRNPWIDPRIRGEIIFIPDYPWFPQGATLQTMAADYRVLYPNWDEALFRSLSSAFPAGQSRGKVSTLSKGMQRQAALLLALSARPSLLLLDEIFDGLDPVVRRLARQSLMDAVTQRGASILLASNSLRELEEICDSIVLLYQGRVVLQQPADALKTGIVRVQAAFAGPKTRADFAGLNLLTFHAHGRIVTLTARGDRPRVIAQIRSMQPEFLEDSYATLEEAIISEMEGAGYGLPNA